MYLQDYLEEQIAFSKEAFGSEPRLEGVLEHIKEEVEEVRESPNDLEEWIDLVMLSLDGAWRSGHNVQEIIAMLKYKLDKNKNRDWPDWKTSDPTKPINHVKNKA